MTNATQDAHPRHRLTEEGSGYGSNRTDSFEPPQKTNWRKIFILIAVSLIAAGVIVSIVIPVCIAKDCMGLAESTQTTKHTTTVSTTKTTSTTRRTPWTTLTTTPSITTTRGPATTLTPLSTSTTRGPLTLPTFQTSSPVSSTTTTQASAERQETVLTKFGPVTGHRVDVMGNGNLAESIVSYLGVPYAKPPVGPLRWKKPLEPDVWSQAYIADKLPSMCVQEAWALQATHQGWDDFSEDCLYMNIYTPADASKDPYPVFLWIHGGGFQVSGSVQYPGHFPALKGVVIVSINYRLGLFGFMSTDDPASDSNYGLWDQLQALKFVRENINSFGGDPDKITIGGESAGGVAIGLMLISPHTAGLFHQAVMQSGTEMATWAVGDPTITPDANIYHVAAAHGCDRPTNAEMLDCLREIDAFTLHDTNISCTGCRQYGAVVDGPGGYIPAMPRTMREAGIGHPVPVLAGSNSNENGAIALGLDPAYMFRGMNRSEFKYWVYRLAEGYGPSMTEENAVENLYEALLLAYSPWPFIDNGDENKKAFGHITTDQTFVIPTNDMLHYHTKLAPCYQYMFGVLPYLVVNPIPEWLGVMHAFDLPYLFGWPQIQAAPREVKDDTGGLNLPGIRFANMDRQWSNYFLHLWMNFAKYGDPNGEPLAPPTMEHPVTWEKQTYEKRWYLRMENEEVSSQLNFRQLETSFSHNYVKYVGLGMDIHHDSINGSQTLRLEDIHTELLQEEADGTLPFSKQDDFIQIYKPLLTKYLNKDAL